ncbi:MAG TPA: hypothetical protein VJP78_05710 [Thermoleophilia bacterium]|nr:hypothetical protein [Thermoleophilia bacterium]
MIFRPDHALLVMRGVKTVTRRLVQETDIAWAPWGRIVEVTRRGRSLWRVDGRLVGVDWFSTAGTKTDGSRGGSSATYRQPTYAIQHGRGKAALGRIRIVAIRKEQLQDMTLEDAIAEGVSPNNPKNSLKWFPFIWNAINNRRGMRWEDNPAVWVLTIERLFDVKFEGGQGGTE